MRTPRASMLSPLAVCLLAGFTGCQTDDNADRSEETIGPSEGEPKWDPPPTLSSPMTPQASNLSTLELVHEFQGPIPTGVAVSHDHRIFVSYPRWEDPVEYTVVEITDGHERAYPSVAANAGAVWNPDGLYSVQSVVVDARNRLWCVDTGSVDMQPVTHLDLAKLVCIDLSRNEIVRTIRFPPSVVNPQSYINDVRFDLTRGQDGYAFITDSSAQGSNGIIVVNLATGQSWRRLNDHPTTRAERAVEIRVEGRPLMLDMPDELPRRVTVGSDGLAITPPGERDQRLFYCPLAGHMLHSVSVAALVDKSMSDIDVARTIRSEPRDFASDGLDCDARGRLLLTDYEHNAIKLRQNEGSYVTIVSDPRILWPDSIALGTDGYVYFTANQVNRQKKFNDGFDRRRPPYRLFRAQAEARPVKDDGMMQDLRQLSSQASQ